MNLALHFARNQIAINELVPSGMEVPVIATKLTVPSQYRSVIYKERRLWNIDIDLDESLTSQWWLLESESDKN